MYLRGDLQADIAAELKLSQSTVSNDLATLQNEWRQSSLIDINDRKAYELARVDDLEREYWSAWKRSQEDAEIRIVVKKGVDVEKEGKTKSRITPIKDTKRTEGQSGNPAFLRGIEWCINKRCELLGLDAPKKIAPTNPAGDKPFESPVLIYIPDNKRNDS